jgi:hypothetical protein
MSAYYWATKAGPCPCLIDAHNPKGDACQKEVRDSQDFKDCLKKAPVQIAGTMRSYFVGLLFAVGAILYANKGYSLKEDIALSIAGVSAVLIALFPMPWTGPPAKLSWVHGGSAIVFFASIAFVSAWCSRDTVNLIANPAQQKLYKRLYGVLAFFMIGSPTLAYILNTWVFPENNAIFWVEFCGIWSFAAYWIVKGIEMSGHDTEKMATEGVPYFPSRSAIGRGLAKVAPNSPFLTSGPIDRAVPASLVGTGRPQQPAGEETNLP